MVLDFIEILKVFFLELLRVLLSGYLSAAQDI